ncbi:MAG: fluoride efflux transporter CrcB [Bacteroidales bacterium]|nr:fluoride efflux transporter CrcB [Bacteroidales bacterium]
MIRSILFVAIGGATGAVGRYLLSRLCTASFPWGTLTVNLIGCLLIGLLTGMAGRGTLSADMKLLLVTGFCGGFTTFSTFANESLSMMRMGEVLQAATYIGLSVAAGILAVYAGMRLTFNN